MSLSRNFRKKLNTNKSWFQKKVRTLVFLLLIWLVWRFEFVLPWLSVDLVSLFVFDELICCQLQNLLQLLVSTQVLVIQICKWYKFITIHTINSWLPSQSWRWVYYYGLLARGLSFYFVCCFCWILFVLESWVLI